MREFFDIAVLWAWANALLITGCVLFWWGGHFLSGRLFERFSAGSQKLTGVLFFVWGIRNLVVGVQTYQGLPEWLTVDTLTVFGFAVVGWVLWTGSHHERWRRAWVRFRADRTGVVALIMVGLYLFIGALETIRLPAADQKTKSLLDFAVGGFSIGTVQIGGFSVGGWTWKGVQEERSYSAPLGDHLLTDTKVPPDPLKGKHLLGTDTLGKDVFVQTLKACRTALIIGGLTSVIYIPLGALFGIFAGYFRRWVDDLIQYVYSTLASIPEILLLISILFVLGPGLGSISIALGVTGWVGLCRLVRGETMRQTERPYIAAARALGQGHWQIITRHLLPNVMHLVIINFVLGFSGIVLSEAILSYLGVGAAVGTPSWGMMIDSGRSELGRDPLVWWNLTAATTALFGLVLALNLLGDSLRRAFDPKRS